MSSPTHAPPRGTHDVLPDEWRVRQRIEDVARRRFEAAGYGRISTPTFEHTELFQRGVGEATDVVTKEMYTFTDRGDRSLTLRPEGTASVARAYVNAGMHRWPAPVKLWYAAPMFRYEKPQAGRMREHVQLGCEAFGSDLPAVDAELVALLAGIYDELGVPNVRLRINSIGSYEARSAYRAALVAFLEPHADELDADSRERLTTNPLRILDSKDPRTRAIVADAPSVLDHLTSDDHAHLDAVLELLAAVGITPDVDATLVRGLDYYTRTVFEFSCSDLGAQDAIGGGGRYDGLVELLGGPATPAVGFGCGVERLMLAMGTSTAAAVAPDVYVGVLADAAEGEWAWAFTLVAELRARGVHVELDLAGRSGKGQAKQAARLGTSVRIAAGPSGERRAYARGGAFEGEELGSGDAAASADRVAAMVRSVAALPVE